MALPANAQARPWTVDDVLALKSPGSVVISPDGEWIAFVVTQRDLERNRTLTDLWLVPAGGGEAFQLTRGARDARAPQWAPDGSWLAFLSERDSAVQVHGIRAAGGEAWAVTAAKEGVNAFATRDLGRVAFLLERPTSPPDIHVAETQRFTPARLTDLNPEARSFAYGTQRVVRWRSAYDGEEIEGVLTLPVAYRPAERVPLLLIIHGGPSGVSSNTYMPGGRYPAQVFASLGYASLQPNYRGSTGYGERFRGLNRGHISGHDWVDVESGVDHLIAEGPADPNRLGIMGWSFGGHHTFWGITQTDRFKAASAGAGATDLISMYSQTDLPGFYHTYLGAKPWEDFDLYEQRSAYRFVDRVTTPLLIQVGERDERVPAEQSIQFYEAMTGIGRAPAKLVIYPGEGRGLREVGHVRDMMTRNVEWFTRWIPAKGVAAATARER